MKSSQIVECLDDAELEYLTDLAGEVADSIGRVSHVIVFDNLIEIATTGRERDFVAVLLEVLRANLNTGCFNGRLPGSDGRG